jgi:spermidine synthase
VPQSAAAQGKHAGMPRLAVAFFCSGFGALLCQIVWQRMLGIFAGSDTVSAALVVGAFLLGLGLGSLLGAKVADRLAPARAR